MLAPKVIWILEDDEDCRFIYKETLGIRYHIRWFEDLASFEHGLEQQQEDLALDLIIADLKLPDGSFLESLGRIKSLPDPAVPFIVVSSFDELDVLRACFDEGALDYLTKPFGRSELTVKVERLLVRRNFAWPAQPGRLPRADLPLSLLSNGGVNLTPKEAHIVATLMSAPKYTMRRCEIVERVWGPVKVGTKALDVHLFNIRRKLRDAGYGIKFTAPDRYTFQKETS